MRKLTILLLFISLRLISQDTIRFHTGAIKVVKVTEVGTREIKYYDFLNLTGPVHVIF